MDFIARASYTLRPRPVRLDTRAADAQSGVVSRNLDVIRHGLAEVWSSQGRRFVTFETAERGAPQDDRWVQYLDGELNVRWPLEEEPAPALARRGVALPAGAFVSWHTAGTAVSANAVFAVGDAQLDDVARFVDALFASVIAAGTDASLSYRVDDHG